MNTEPILNIDGLNIYEYVVYKLKKPFYDDYLKIDVVSVHFTRETCDGVRVYFYGNPYKSHTYHPLYNSFADKIEIEGIDEENTMRYEKYLNNKISEYEERLNNFIFVKSKATMEKIEFEKMKDRFKDVNLNDYIKAKLTDKGKEIYRNYYHDIDDEDVPTLDIDEECFCKFQLWEFMKIFGEHFRMCGGLPCETNVKIQIKENNKEKK